MKGHGRIMGVDAKDGKILLEGTYGIERASEFAKLCAEGLGKADVIELDLTAVEDMDLPAIQVLYASKLRSLGGKKEFRLSGTIRPSLSLRFLNAGFIPHAVKDGSELERALVQYQVQEVV